MHASMGMPIHASRVMHNPVLGALLRPSMTMSRAAVAERSFQQAQRQRCAAAAIFTTARTRHTHIVANATAGLPARTPKVRAHPSCKAAVRARAAQASARRETHLRMSLVSARKRRRVRTLVPICSATSIMEPPGTNTRSWPIFFVAIAGGARFARVPPLPVVRAARAAGTVRVPAVACAIILESSGASFAPRTEPPLRCASRGCRWRQCAVWHSDKKSARARPFILLRRVAAAR